LKSVHHDLFGGLFSSDPILFFRPERRKCDLIERLILLEGGPTVTQPVPYSGFLSRFTRLAECLDPLTVLSLNSFCRQFHFSNSELIIARANQNHGFAIFAHPLGGEATEFSGANVPFVGEINRFPRPPGLGGFKDAKTTGKARVFASCLAKILPEEIAFKTGIVAEA